MLRWKSQLVDQMAATPVSGYTTRQRPATEVVALTSLALSAHGRTPEAHTATDWLAAQQAGDGSVGIREGLASPRWPTSLAALAWHADGSYASNASQAIRWILQAKGNTLPKGGYCAHDTSLVGWPWVVGTHSWLEPTAWAILALRSAGMSQHDRATEATRLLLDRILPSGGCNYGNTVVLGQTLRPHVEPTGLAMLALAGQQIDDSRIERSLGFLQTSMHARQGTASLCFAILGLAAHDRLPADWPKYWQACARRTMSGNASPYKVALLALAGLGVDGPLIRRAKSIAGSATS